MPDGGAVLVRNDPGMHFAVFSFVGM